MNRIHLSAFILIAASCAFPAHAGCPSPQLVTYTDQGLVNIPTVELPSGECFSAVLRLTAVQPVMRFELISAAPYQDIRQPEEQVRTERLAGIWDFSYQIISTFKNRYTLYPGAQASSYEQIPYYLGGVNESDKIIIAGWSPTLGQYALQDVGTIITRFFVFDFTGENVVQGCYYQIDNSTSDISSCYAMTGVRIATPSPASSENRERMGVAQGTEMEKEMLAFDENALMRGVSAQSASRSSDVMSGARQSVLLEVSDVLGNLAH